MNEIFRAAPAGGARGPGRHQPSALRLAQGHHGGEEEGDRRAQRRPISGSTRATKSASPARASRSLSVGVPGERRGRADPRRATRRPRRSELVEHAAHGSEGALMAGKVWAVLQQREGKLHRMVLGGDRRRAAAGGADSAATAEAVLLGSGVAGARDRGRGAPTLARGARRRSPRARRLHARRLRRRAARRRCARPSARASWSSRTPTSRSTTCRGWRRRSAPASLPEVIAFEGAARRRWSSSARSSSGKLHARVRVRGAGTDAASRCSPAPSRADGRAAARRRPSSRGRRPRRRSAPEREILGVEEVGGDTVDLTKAEIIVAVGRGVGGADKMGPIQELAAALGAEIGASRPVIDNGWLPRDRQIGSSGQTVAPKLYLAVGISGAIQHLVGMKGSTAASWRSTRTPARRSSRSPTTASSATSTRWCRR